MISKLKYIINILISLIIFPLYKITKRNKIWLFGSGNGLFENNIAAFYDFIKNKEAHRNDRIYFITNDIANIPIHIQKHALIRGSIKCYCLSLISNYIIFDTCNSDVAPGIQKYLLGLKIYLNHGFEGLKKLPPDYYKKIKADIYCSSSEEENNIKVKFCGAPEENTFITGYPRFDKIPPHNKKSIKNILYFPTWRPWLDGEQRDDTLISNYIDNIITLLSSTRLHRYLEENDCFLYYKPHHKVKHLNINKNIHKNIIFLDQKDNLTDIIAITDILITDYSSVSWDYLFNDRNVIFYAFDIDEYIDRQGLYYDIKTNETYCNNANEAITILKKISEIELSKNAMTNIFFKYKDSNNCERLYSLIKNINYETKNYNVLNK